RAVLLQFQLDMIDRFIPAPVCVASVINWQNCLNIIQSTTSPTDIVVFRDRVMSRAPIYNDSFNIFNHLLSFENSSVAEISQLKLSDFPSRLEKQGGLPKCYVSWHARYSEKWAPERNLSPPMFFRYLDRIKKLHPGKDIILVSDRIGCDYYKKLLKEADNNSGANITFSKDYGGDFFDDCFIILNSVQYFQLLGGGIGMIPIFSTMPYEIIDQCWNEKPWAHPKFTSWATADQNRYFHTDEIQLAMSDFSVAQNTIAGGAKEYLVSALNLQGQGKDVEAEVVLRDALSVFPKEPLLWYALATILIARNDSVIAMECLDFAVSVVDSYAPLWFARGIELVKADRRDDALTSYDRAIELDPNYLDALTNSCVLLQELQRPQAALERYSRILAIRGQLQ
ncbi:MAG: tetratricopeptide repeat protein, partial [Rhodoferax sp.]|nr:tetratricopeptide repeat protein [Rhodoferax sp.]